MGAVQPVQHRIGVLASLASGSELFDSAFKEFHGPLSMGRSRFGTGRTDPRIDGGDGVARPKNQDERRRQLVEATAAAVGERGLSGLRLKDIADHAGLSIGSVLYYYPDLDALLVEVHQQAVDQFYWARVTATQAEPDPLRRLVVAVEEGIPTDVDDPTVRVIYELHLASARDERHASLLTRLWELEVSLYVDLLERGEAAGVLTLPDGARAVAETVVALEDAFDLHLLARNDSIARDLAVARALGYLSLATGATLEPTRRRRGARVG